MADMDSTARHNHEIATNTYATLVCSDQHDLRRFSATTSRRLASMLHVLAQVHQDIDGGFVTDMLELANDLAFQLQESIGILAVGDFQTPGDAPC